ncbi:MAG: non-ribosomal peptide synthetase [Gammaproteobacteria bacterium]
MKKILSSEQASAIAEKINALSPEKQALLKRGLDRLKDNNAMETISGKRCQTPLPTSYAQQRMWLLDQMIENGAVYNISWLMSLSGPVDVRILNSCFNEIIRRHESLRTTFSGGEKEPVQIISPGLVVDLPVIDLFGRREGLPDGREIETLLDDFAALPFDLEQGPMLRMQLLKLEDLKFLLQIVVHHIVSDGWSLSVLNQELEALYNASVGGQAPDLPELTVQYADFAAWQRRRFEDGKMARHLTYWKSQLEDLSAAELPTDRPRPASQSYRGARLPLAIPSELTAKLNGLARKNGATLFMILLGAFMILLHRLSGRCDIAVGTPIAGRNRQEIESLIGFFVNTLVLRGDLSGNPAFGELLARVRGVCLDAYEHQDIPFEKLVAELQPHRDMSRHPFFQTMLVLHNTPDAPLNMAGIEAEPLIRDSRTAKFDLSLDLTESALGLQGGIQYATDLFEHETIVRLAGHFTTLLESIAENPDCRISQLPLMTPHELHQILHEWNDTFSDFPRNKCIHHLFEEQADKTPDATALIFEGTILSYRELDARADRLAHELLELGAGPETIVGVCLPHSMDIVVSIMAVLKAGGAYAPLDPNYPADRLAYMLEDTRAPVLIAHSESRSLFSTYSGKIVYFDQLDDEFFNRRVTRPESGATPDNLAYVMYTSGTTGRPKGVLITHSSVVNHLHWAVNQYGIDKTDCVLFKGMPGFDISVIEIFWPLLSGARMVIAKPEGHMDAGYIADLIAAENVTVACFVPSLLQLFLEEKKISACTSLKRVLSGGEALSLRCVREFRNKLGAELHNLYGPTETTIHASYWDCSETGSKGSVPIGRPCANTRIYLLDIEMQPVPIGIPGELHIGGVQLARGYLNQPELTAEKFVADPFSSDPDDRLYKSGDLARFLPDGNIEFLGRSDHQIKLRGFRIETAEIESVLRLHPQVKDAVVNLFENRQGNQFLAAYLIVPSSFLPSHSDLQNHLRHHLPDYMIPAAFVFLESFPLNRNGKIDRKALPDPDHHRPKMEQSYTPPNSPVEHELVKIWEEVLEIDPVGIHDNFFELGGHSLLATQVQSRIQNRFQIEMPLRWVFDFPEISKLALKIIQSQIESGHSNDLDSFVAALDNLSEEEAQSMLETINRSA